MKPTSAPLNAEPAVINVWEIPLIQPASRMIDCEKFLDERERTKLASFHFDRDRQRYLASHGALRLILAQDLGQAPDEIIIVQEGWKKPHLADSKIPLEFNLSHSGDFALIAVSHGHAVGVDIEQMKTDIDLHALASRFFSTAESRTLFQLPAEAQTRAFFHIWTRKEAFLKGRGDGLSLPLAEFDVSLEAECTSALLTTRFDPQESARWRVSNLSAVPGYAAALAVQGQDWIAKSKRLLDW